MYSCSSVVEHSAHNGLVMGSIPIKNTSVVTQLVRVIVCHTGGRRFKSYPSHLFNLN